jgi:hypothetical protein
VRFFLADFCEFCARMRVTQRNFGKFFGVFGLWGGLPEGPREGVWGAPQPPQAVRRQPEKNFSALVEGNKNMGLMRHGKSSAFNQKTAQFRVTPVTQPGLGRCL